jgi:hypothetical protein
MVHWGKRGRFAVDEAASIVQLVRMKDDAIRAGVGSGWRFEGLP